MTNPGLPPGAPTAAPPAAEQYKLMRARNGRMIAGVAAGLSKASGLDVTVARICIGATMLSGIGFAAYFLLWIVLPEESPKRGRAIEPAPEHTAKTIRLVVIGLAVLSVLNKFGGLWPFANSHAGTGMGWDGLLGLILLSIGIGVLFSRHRPDRHWWDQPSYPPTTASSPTPPADPAPAGDDAIEDDPPSYVGPFGDAMGQVNEAMAEAFAEVRTTLAEGRIGRRHSDDEYAPTTPIATVTSNGLVRSGGAALAWSRVIGWFLLIWWTLGSIALYLAWCFNAVSISNPWLLAGASLLVVMAVIRTLVHAKFARAVVPALALLLIPVALGGALVRAQGPVGDHLYRPTGERFTTNYRQAAGRMQLDLADAAFPANKTTTINARMGTGAIIVTVPDQATIEVRTRVRSGGYELFGEEGRFHWDGGETVTAKGCEGAPKIVLNLRSGAGYMEVNREHGGRNATNCKAA